MKQQWQWRAKQAEEPAPAGSLELPEVVKDVAQAIDNVVRARNVQAQNVLDLHAITSTLREGTVL